MGQCSAGPAAQEFLDDIDLHLAQLGWPIGASAAPELPDQWKVSAVMYVNGLLPMFSR